MPCWQVRTTTVDLKQQGNEVLLERAFKALNIEVVKQSDRWVLWRQGVELGTYRRGQLELRSTVDLTLVNQIKQQYTRQAVYQIGRVYQLKLQADPKQVNRIIASR